MTEAIHIQKDVPTANWVSNSGIRQKRSQIHPSPHSQLVLTTLPDTLSVVVSMGNRSGVFL